MTKATDSTKANGDRPVLEIEITPEMIRAGVREFYSNSVLVGWDSQEADIKILCGRIFASMINSSGKSNDVLG